MCIAVGLSLCCGVTGSDDVGNDSVAPRALTEGLQAAVAGPSMDLNQTQPTR